jgi:hypothetical protein
LATRRNGSSQTRRRKAAKARCHSKTPLRRHEFRERNVETYRLYCLDGAGKVTSAEWIDAVDDKAAIEIAERLRGGRACELWQNNRFVRRLRASEDADG